MTEKGPRKQIMLVDDDRDMCDTVKDRLERLLDVSVRTFYDGDSMLDELNSSDRAPYDVVILDMWLPRRERGPIEVTMGVKLLKAYHILAPGTPIIIYTAHETFENCVECIKAGAYDYIPKVGKEPARHRLLESCRKILDPPVDELDVWVANHGKELVERCGGRYAAVLPLREATSAQIEFTTVGDSAIVTGYSLGDVRHSLLRNRLLRWTEPRIVKVPRHEQL